MGKHCRRDRVICEYSRSLCPCLSFSLGLLCVKRRCQAEIRAGSWRASHPKQQRQHLVDATASPTTRQLQHIAPKNLTCNSSQICHRKESAKIARITSIMSAYRAGTQTSAVWLHVNIDSVYRKTGITLTDRGVYDEHGLEPISGIFSSPEKSPPKRGSTVTASESMDIQDSK